MTWVCPSCGFKGNHDSTIRCSCGYEITLDEERKYSKPSLHWTWRDFLLGFFISFSFVFMLFLFDFFDTRRFFWSGFPIAFVACLAIGILAGLTGEKFYESPDWSNINLANMKQAASVYKYYGIQPYWTGASGKAGTHEWERKILPNYLNFGY